MKKSEIVVGGSSFTGLGDFASDRGGGVGFLEGRKLKSVTTKVKYDSI